MLRVVSPVVSIHATVEACIGRGIGDELASTAGKDGARYAFRGGKPCLAQAIGDVLVLAGDVREVELVRR